MRLVIATHNRKKANEMRQILGARFPGLVLATLDDYPGAPEPDETGATYAENATIKAESAAAFTGEWAVGDDSGLEVDAMGGQPGLHSKRFGGEDAPFSEKMRMVLDRLAETSAGERGARFRCFVALAIPGEPTRVFEATCEGTIAHAPVGEGGFGYDPIFLLPEGRTMAQLTSDEKHARSHRGKVLRALGDYLASRSEFQT
ncbi:MAG: RdgB/HAM1 family non-canonical purine NTP pyrophosphatase [Fimbriimonadaceae bacterium]|nr:RdgB/HAM1 family non-canonical purine NTP pyrophosphatase [Fimbriimonadaceae bacterium]